MGQYLRFESCLYSFYLCLLTDRRSFDDAQSRLKCRKLLGIGGKEPSKVSHYSKLNNPLIKQLGARPKLLATEQRVIAHDFFSLIKIFIMFGCKTLTGLLLL